MNLRDQFFLFFLLLASTLSAQENIQLSGIVTDNNGQSLDYVNIGVLGTDVGTVSDQDGKYTLILKPVIGVEDSICFSIIGYESKFFILKNLLAKSDHNIELSEKIFDLSEVVVKPEFANLKEKGSAKTSSKRNVNFAISQIPNQNLGSEIGKRFKIKKQSFLESYKFYISQNDFDTVGFRINVYEMKNGKPGDLILKENILYEIQNQKTGWVEINLAPYNIYANENIIVSLSWIYHSEKGNRLKLPISFPVINGFHYYRFAARDKWKKFKNMSTPMLLKYSY